MKNKTKDANQSDGESRAGNNFELAGFPLALTQIVLDESSPLHLYEQLSRALRAAILSGDLPAGTLLPTGRELADALKIGRSTIVAAYARLTAEGFLHTNRRRGTRVTERALGARVRRDERSAPRTEDDVAARNLSGWPNARRIDISFKAKHTLETSNSENATAGPFALNAPDPSLYPRNTLSRLLADEFCRPPVGAGALDGRAKFQSAVMHFLLNMRGVDCEAEQIIPVRSLKSALDLTATLMIDPGHYVYAEDPAHEVIADSMGRFGAQLITMPADSNGADISRVAGPPPRLVITSPSVGFPFGQQMSEMRRMAMLDMARTWNAMIFECDSQWELFYSGNRLRSLQGRDFDAPIFYFGSLTETLGPHIHAGYLVVPSRLLKPFSEIAQRVAHEPEPFILGALATFIENSDYAVHTKMIRSVYAERARLLVDAIKSSIPGATVHEPSGGLNLALLFDDGVDERTICRAAADRGMPVTPLSRFWAGERRDAPRGLALGFGAIPERMIETMVRRLGEVIAEVRQQQLAA